MCLFWCIGGICCLHLQGDWTVYRWMLKWLGAGVTLWLIVAVFLGPHVWKFFLSCCHGASSLMPQAYWDLSASLPIPCQELLGIYPVAWHSPDSIWRHPWQLQHSLCVLTKCQLETHSSFWVGNLVNTKSNFFATLWTACMCFNSHFYKQTDRVTMGLHLSLIVASHLMENFEERGVIETTYRPSCCFSYVDDVVMISPLWAESWGTSWIA